MIEVDLSYLDIGEIIKQNLAKAKAEVHNISGLQEKYAYIDRHELWKDTLGALARLTKNSEDDCICWYCECDGSAGFYFQVDHFRPKSRVRYKGRKKSDDEPGYWWLAYNPENYRISCQRCNTAAGKRDQFPLAELSPRSIREGGEKIEHPLLLDPCQTNDANLLVFSKDGDVHPIPNCFEDDKLRAETSIDVYNLRNRCKREARRRAWMKCEELIMKALQARIRLKHSFQLSDSEKKFRKIEFEVACTTIRKLTLSNTPFSSTSKSCIREFYKIGITRAIKENIEPDLDWLLALVK